MRLFIYFLLLLFPLVVFSQRSEKIIVDTKDLPKEVIDQIKAKQKLETTKEWTGLGKEIGEGADAIFGSLNKNAVEFGQSTPGVILLGILAWKVMGTDFLQAVIGIPLFLIGLVVFPLFFYKTYVPRSVVSEIIYDEKGKKTKKKYEILNTGDVKFGQLGYHRAGYWACFMGYICITAFISLI